MNNNKKYGLLDIIIKNILINHNKDLFYIVIKKIILMIY
jgi:hypothetical protein